MLYNSQHGQAASKKSITQIMSILGAFAACVFALSTPIAYYAISISEMRQSLTSEAEFLAKSLEKLIQSRPNLWEFESIRLMEIISKPLTSGKEHEVEIRNVKGTLVAKTDFIELDPIISVSETLFDSGRLVGSIVVRHSIRTQIIIAAILGIFTSLLGYLIYVIFRSYPIRILKNTLNELQESEQKYRELVENANSIIVRWSQNGGKILFMNEFGLKYFGYTQEEIAGRHLVGSIVPENESTGRDLTALLDKIISNPQDFEQSINENVRSNGERVWISWTNKVMTDGEGKVLEVLSIGSDITERKRAEDALREVTQRLQLATDSGHIGIWDRDIQSGTLLWNDKMFEIYGVSKNSFTPSFDAWQHCLHPEDYDRAMEASRAAFLGEQEFIIEYRILLPDGAMKWIRADSRVIRDAGGKPLRMIGINRDISKRKFEEIKSQASLREKEMLLKEIHHRVKNNLQVISSMLSMQARNVGDETVLSVLRESQNRVRAMAAVHSMLYKSNNFAEINFGVYIQDMAKQLFSSYNINPEVISLSISVENVLLSIETAIPCGLIINELISNALKHAFPDNKTGEIKIELSQGNSEIRIIFEDNGVGFPENVDFKKADTLGLDLINLLVEQLEGTIELHRNGGTRYMIMLKREESQEEFYVDRRKN